MRRQVPAGICPSCLWSQTMHGNWWRIGQLHPAAAQLASQMGFVAPAAVRLLSGDAVSSIFERLKSG